jgi:ComF family protein
MIRRLRSIGHALAQAALAAQCPACGRPAGHQKAGVCLACWDEVDADRFPAAPAAAGLEAVHPVVAVGPYRGRLRRVVRCFKFSGLPGLARPLGERLAAALDGRSADVVVPVPLHWSRRWRRGYNQADLLARVVGRSIGCPGEPGALRRVRRTAPQRGATRDERARNVRGAFAAKDARLEGARVLLVDDVVTTGATLTECARMLEEAGAIEVRAAAVARTMTRSDS